jgi:electron transport complex protein RnfE
MEMNTAAKNGPGALSILGAGIIKENPVLRLVLGTCPTLAVTSSAENGLGMGLATLAVLVASNALISLVRHVIPDKVRIPAYVVIIAGLVTIVQMLIQAYLPALDKALGIFIPLIVVNCIILGRAEMFAAKNPVGASILDGIGMGVGFTLALFAIGSVREFFGAGAWMGISLTADLWPAAAVLILPPGGFLAFGAIIGLLNKVTNQRITATGCATCSMEAACAPKETSK